MTVIEDGDELGDWGLVVEDGDVIARRTVPYDGVLTYSTEDKPNRVDRNSEYRLDARDVVRRYVDQSSTEGSFGDLIDQVQLVLAGREVTL